MSFPEWYLEYFGLIALVLGLVVYGCYKIDQDATRAQKEADQNHHDNL